MIEIQDNQSEEVKPRSSEVTWFVADGQPVKRPCGLLSSWQRPPHRVLYNACDTESWVSS